MGPQRGLRLHMSRSLVVVRASRSGRIEPEMGPIGRAETAGLAAFIPDRRLGHVLRKAALVQSATAPLASRHCDARAPAVEFALAVFDHQAVRGRGQSTATLLGDGEEREGVAMGFEGGVLVGDLERMRDGNRGGSRDVVDGVGQSHGRRASNDGGRVSGGWQGSRRTRGGGGAIDRGKCRPVGLEGAPRNAVATRGEASTSGGGVFRLGRW